MEKWQSNFKQQQMRENLVESLRLRELTDREHAENLIKKEAQINKLYQAQQAKQLNIHDNSVKKIGQHNLNMMHQTPDK